ncbi:MAG: hypothetical protein Kow0090_06650 [Myxococcota bacterium]
MRRFSLIVLVAILFGAPMKVHSQEQAGGGRVVIKVAVLNISAQAGIEENIAVLINEAFLAEIRKRPELNVIGMAEIKTMLGYEEQKQTVGCTDDSCVIEIGGALGVDRLVTGVLGRLGNSFLINVKLLNIRDATVEKQVSHRIKAESEEALLDALPEIAEELFGKSSERGKEGHIVKTEKREEKVEKVGAEKEMESELIEEEGGGASIWAWIIGGAGAAALGAGAGFGFFALKMKEKGEKLVEESKTERIEAVEVIDRQNDVNTNAKIAHICFIAGGALAATSAVLFILTSGSEGGGASSFRLTPAIAPEVATVNITVNY